MNALHEILSKGKAQDLEEGIHDNCRIIDVDIQPRETNKGERIKRNTYIKLGKFDTKGKRKLAEKEISWFNIDPTSQYVLDNFREQIIQMAGILKCYYSEEEVVSKFDIFKGVTGFDTAMEENTDLEIDVLEVALKNKPLATKLLTNAITSFWELMQGKYGYDSDLIRIKLTFDKSGKYIQQPGYGNFAESMQVPEESSELKMSKTESKYITSARDYSKVGADIKAGDLSAL